ncbi:Aste57867_14766 [Aphanomyces stellatus]|uniref:Aste57867_14766 protein n=1 Tax=Aphanomyces stellatus TaxID=120398 RepID=A0A485L2G6_9STRA|nr:hypothetical protein As57867_014711 [Aphanomyces stellatus]VFT91584.1 Aste57867_14766 [Aphanomyces stellatus]
MADKRKHSSTAGGRSVDDDIASSSDDELSEKNLRKRLRQTPFLDDELVPASSPESEHDANVSSLELHTRPPQSGRLRRSVRETKPVVQAAPTTSTTRGKRTADAKAADVPLIDYDTFLKQHGINEKARGRRSGRPVAPKRTWSSGEEDTDASEEPKVKPKRGRGRSKKAATPKTKGKAKQPAKKGSKSSSSSDTDDFVVPEPVKGKRGRSKKATATKDDNDDDDASSDESSEDGGAAFKKNRGKKKSTKRGKKTQSSSDENEDLRDYSVNVDDDDDDDDETFIIDKVLARETHTALEWDRKCAGMHTHYVSRGSLFVDDDEEDKAKKPPAASDDTTQPMDGTNDDETSPGVEKFLIKWRNLSYLHVTWETEAGLIEYEKNAKGKLQRFIEREARQLLMDDVQGDEYFNPEFCTVDRILTIQPTDVPHENGKKGFQMEYYVKWKALPYDECTWEQEVDVHDDMAVQLHHEFNKEPAAVPAKRKGAPFRPYNDQNPIQFKNDMQLRDYQLTGVNWMIFNWYNKRNSLLADEMGLGKTVQTVAYINHLVTKEGLRGPYLIIAPLSTLSHWQREFTSWTHLNAIVFHGSQDARKTIEQYEFYRGSSETGKAKPSNPPRYRFDVLITTFEMCTANDYLTLARIKWQLAVVDEAHRLKNKKSKLSVMLEDKFHYENMLLLTGTPLQNNVEELWTLLHFLDSEKFHSAQDFIDNFGDLKDSSQVEKLHNELKPFLLRRMKEDVEKSLAPKEETIVEVELTVFQKQYYRAIYERNSEFLSRGGKKAQAPSLMNIVMELRKCCNHPFLIRGAEERELARLQKEQPKNVASSVRRETVQKQLNDLLVTSCGKLVLLDKLLPRLRENGHRVLIFSQFKIMLNILEDYLRMRGYPRERIDGSITGNDRQAAIDRYCDPQSASFIMLLSTRAGGVGINLTAADTCIIYDSDWNPQNDLQAQARCHRIGQKKSVKVYRLLTSKTYELHMFHQASMKLGLDQAVLGGIRDIKSTTSKKGPTKEEIESLLKYGAYEMFKEEKEGEAEAASKKFSEESVDEILSRSTTVIHDPKKQENAFSSSFSKATFVSSANPDEQVALDDPDFWVKVIGLTGVADEVEKKSKTPEKRRCRGRKTYTEIGSDDDGRPRGDKDGEYKFEEMSESSSDDDDLTPEGKSSGSGSYSNVHKFHQNFVTALLTYGYGRWTKIRMSDPILTHFSVAKIKEYAMGFMVQMIRVACMDNTKDASGGGDPSGTTTNDTQMKDAMRKMALKFRFVVHWLQMLYREKNPQSQTRELVDLHQIPVQEELSRLNVVASLTRTAGKHLQLLENLFLVDQYITKRLSPMLEVMSVLNMPYQDNGTSSSSPHGDVLVVADDVKPSTDVEPQPQDEDGVARKLVLDADTTSPTDDKDSVKQQPENGEPPKTPPPVETVASSDDTTKTEPSVDKADPSPAATPSNGDAAAPDSVAPKGDALVTPKLKPEVVLKWTRYFQSLYALPAIPVVEWWTSPNDDIRLLYVVHRYGWLKGSKPQFQLIRSDRLLFPASHPGGAEKAAWPSLAVLNKRIKSIIKYWADKSIAPAWPVPKSGPQPSTQGRAVTGPRPQGSQAQFPPSAVGARMAHAAGKVRHHAGHHPAIPGVATSVVAAAAQLNQAKTSQAFLQQMWERRGRFMGLIMSHGIPDVRLCTSPAEEREKWRYFLYDPHLRAKHFSPQELFAEAISLEQACRCFLNNVKPPMTTDRSIFGAFRNDWILTMEQAHGILYRIELFRLLRREVLILRPAELLATMAHVLNQIPSLESAPSWWKSPDCDILLMQGVECYGLDDHIKEMWLLELFQRLNPTQSFPSVKWVDTAVMACAKAIVRARRAAEQMLEEQKLANAQHPSGHHAMPVLPSPQDILRSMQQHVVVEEKRGVDEATVAPRETAAMELEDPHCNTKAFMWYMLQKKDAELHGSDKFVRHEQSTRTRRDLVERQIEQERQMRERELERSLGRNVARNQGRNPPTRAPEVIEIDDSD